eukprot:3963218-Prymnesium_polylepis.1
MRAPGGNNPACVRFSSAIVTKSGRKSEAVTCTQPSAQAAATTVPEPAHGSKKRSRHSAAESVVAASSPSHAPCPPSACSVAAGRAGGRARCSKVAMWSAAHATRGSRADENEKPRRSHAGTQRGKRSRPHA